MAQVVTTGKTFEEILDVVAAIAEVDAQAILSRTKTAEVVDARHIFVQLLVEQGWYQARIARKMGINEGTVSRMLDHFSDRCKYAGSNINNVIKTARENIKK
jgi:DNA-binding NarL/FixJ family response regulator